MTSYTSESSFLSSGGEGSDSGFSSFGSPPANNHFPGSATVTVIQEEEPLTHPLLSNLNKEVVVVDSLGFAIMQTKSAWEKQMAEKAKEDLKKEKKAARKAKNSHHAPIPTATLSKKEKKAKKEAGEIVDADA